MNKQEFIPTQNQLNASNPNQSVWVSANAGSGKTHVLVERVMRLLLSGAPPASILCITYTKAAAAEMAERLFSRLSEWTNLDEQALASSLKHLDEDGDDAHLRIRARRLFTQALETPGGLKIQTIHAFCERLLHLFPVEAGISPGFTVMDERRGDELQIQATSIILAQAEYETDSPIARAFTSLTATLNEEQFLSLISDFIVNLRKLNPEVLNFEPATYELALRKSLGLSHLNFEDIEVEFNTIDREAYVHHAKQLEPFGKHGKINPPVQLFEIAQSPTPSSLLEDYYLTDKSAPRASLISVAAAKANPLTVEFLLAEQFRVDALKQRCGTLLITTQSANAFHLAKEILVHIAKEKQRFGIYDFQDLITRAADLLSTKRSTQWVLSKLDQGLTHILVDEAQDTSPDQWRIVKALAEEFFAGAGRPQQKNRSLFVVGDQKQSIFSFQGADVQGFTKTQSELSEQSSGQMQLVELTTSYRSTVNVLKAVDAVIPPAMIKQLGIVDLNLDERGHTPSRHKEQGTVEIWPLFEDDDDTEKQDAWTKPVDRPPESSPRRKLAKQIATTIAGWLSNTSPRMLVSQNRAVQPGDILILFQTRSELYRMVLAELRQQKINVAGADRLKLLESLIVQDVVMLLNWLLLPQDDHALAVILKSPLVPKPLTEQELFILCHDRQNKPLANLLEGPNAAYLAKLQSNATTCGPFAMLSTILTASRKSIAQRLGSEALEASNAMLDLALDYEAEHGQSLFGFLRWFTATETTLKRDMDKAKGDVRLMTVHGAKGLEAKIVIMADATYVKKAKDSMPFVIEVPRDQIIGAGLPVWQVSGVSSVTPELQSWSDRHVKQLQEERLRLLYVAMTRAADELYICGTKNKKRVPEPAWWHPIVNALGEPQNDQPIRIGAADVEAISVEPHAPTAIRPAPWLFEIPAPEPTQRKQNPSRQNIEFNAAATKHGTALHRLLQDIADVPAERRFSVARQRAIALDLSEADASQMVSLISRDDVSIFFGKGSQSEVDIIGNLPEGIEISGRIDRITIKQDGIWLLDYKTNQAGPEPLSSIHPYVRQLAQYYALLKLAYPQLPVKAALLWTKTGLLEYLPEPLITAALQEIEQPVT